MPALTLGARGDTLAHLAATNSLHSLPDLLSFYFSQGLNEPLLFRPLLHVLLAIQIGFFRFDFFYWQAMSLLLHLLVIWQMIKILTKVSTSTFWYAWVALFSILTISAEMVAWPQICGYLIFIFCFLQTLKALIDTLEGNDQVLRMANWLLLSVFFYEFSIVCCVVFFCTLQLAKRKLKVPVTRPWLILMPLTIIFPFLFSCANHKMITQLSFSQWIAALIDAWAGILYALLPAMLSFKPHVGRMCLNGLAFTKWSILLTINILAIFLLALWFLLKIRQTPNPISPKTHLLAQTCALLFILQTFFVAIRCALHPIDNYLHLSLYHYYFILLLFFLWLPLAVARPKTPRLPTRLYGILTAAISLLILINAISAHQTYQALAQRMLPWTNFITQTNRFIKSHRAENNFSFQVVYTQSSLPLPMEFPGGKRTERPEFEIFFKPYTSEHPTYYLVYFQDTGLSIFTVKNEALEFTKRTLSRNPKL